ncbi:hypothetical protein HID58_028755, partial [Brassica napus]
MYCMVKRPGRMKERPIAIPSRRLASLLIKPRHQVGEGKSRHVSTPEWFRAQIAVPIYITPQISINAFLPSSSNYRLKVQLQISHLSTMNTTTQTRSTKIVCLSNGFRQWRLHTLSLPIGKPDAAPGEGSVFTLSGFDVSRKNPKFRLSDALLSIWFNDGTSFEKRAMTVRTIPTEMFRFPSYDQLPELANTGKQLPDIMGELSAIRNTIMLTLRLERHFRLDTSVCVSMFDSLALAFHSKFDSYGREPRIVAVIDIVTSSVVLISVSWLFIGRDLNQMSGVWVSSLAFFSVEEDPFGVMRRKNMTSKQTHGQRLQGSQRSCEEVVGKGVMSTVNSSTRMVSEVSRLKQIALKETTNDDDELDDLIDQFGEVLVKDSPWKLNDARLAAILQGIDSNTYGLVNYAEFVVVTLHAHISYIHLAFNYRLIKFPPLHQTGLKRSIESLLAEAGVNEDRRISIHEFHKLLRSAILQVKNSQKPSWLPAFSKNEHPCGQK